MVHFQEPEMADKRIDASDLFALVCCYALVVEVCFRRAGLVDPGVRALSNRHGRVVSHAPVVVASLHAGEDAKVEVQLNGHDHYF